MVHKIFAWFAGILFVSLKGVYGERFINLCRNHNIILWNISKDKEGTLYFNISLKDIYKVKTLRRKCRVRIRIIERRGWPFIVQKVKKRWSFFSGLFFFFVIMIFFSTRIWIVEVEGESYHSDESIKKYLRGINVYSGMAIKELSCNKIEEKLRKKYKDIGWANAEKNGSRLTVHIREVILVSKSRKKHKRHIIATDSGRVVSIVTRNGRAKVKAGKIVKKGDILISGNIKIYGDGDEIIEKNYVSAEGTVNLLVTKDYKDILKKKHQKTVYSGRTRKIYGVGSRGKKFFFYNPIKNLESYEKYDIIRESGFLCPFLSDIIPVRYDIKKIREYSYIDATYSKNEAEKILFERFKNYIDEMRKKGYRLKENEISFSKMTDSYFLSGKLEFVKKQDEYRLIHKKNHNIKKDSKTNGDNGNNN